MSEAGHGTAKPAARRSDVSVSDLYRIAQVLKSNGVDGELILGFRDIAPEDISIEEPVFICYDGLPVPFFIESFSRKGQSKAVVRLTGIRSHEDAQEIVGQGVFAEPDSVAAEPAEGDFSMLEGWALLDDSGSEIGTVSGYLDIPGNPCIEVVKSKGISPEGLHGETVIIPLHDDLIVSVDEDARRLSMIIPDGLL